MRLWFEKHSSDLQLPCCLRTLTNIFAVYTVRVVGQHRLTTEVNVVGNFCQGYQDSYLENQIKSLAMSTKF